MSPVPWRIVQLECIGDVEHGVTLDLAYYVAAEAPPEVVPAVWTHEGCETCGRTEFVCDYDPEADYHGCMDTRCDHNRRPCPDGRLVPWSGECD